MKKGIETRYAIFEILKSLKNKNIGLSTVFSEKISEKKFSIVDRKMIKSVVLYSMRYHIVFESILKKNIKKINFKSDTYFLLLGALTQLIILSYKNFAVINSTVELAKNKKILASPKLINGFLRNIDRQQINFSKLIFNFEQLPTWFKERVCDWSKNKKEDFNYTIKQEPCLHIVFKKKNDFKKIDSSIIKTSKYSAALTKTVRVETIENFDKGVWWIQDYSVMAPLYLIDNLKNKTIADLCAAPGGKSFQLISQGAKIHAYDKNLKRLKMMKNNLKRLGYLNKCVIICKDVFKINENYKYDLVVLDAPCSAIGTIRRNPEIFYRKHNPNFTKILDRQYKLMLKAKNLLKPNGELIYMVCSFLKDECENQIYKFLKANKDFKKIKFTTENSSDLKQHINKQGFYQTIPCRLKNNVLVDGFFAARLQKND